MTSSGSDSPSPGQVNLAGIVLAAGRSSRFGSDKRLAPHSANDTLLTQSIAVIEPACARVFVVTRVDDRDRGRELLGRWWGRDKVEQLCASDAEQGMGSSLANAISDVLAFEQAHRLQFDGVLLMLADMPYIDPITITKVVAAHSLDNIVLPCYQCETGKRWGHPVLFGRSWFNALQALHGDRGGRSIIQAHASARVEIAVNDPGILRDVDKPEDIGTPGDTGTKKR
ncbi:MAG: nucleotidyltransferase family protein [Cellvibrionaceae bacterium]